MDKSCISQRVDALVERAKNEKERRENEQQASLEEIAELVLSSFENSPLIFSTYVKIPDEIFEKSVMTPESLCIYLYELFDGKIDIRHTIDDSTLALQAVVKI